MLFFKRRNIKEKTGCEISRLSTVEVQHGKTFHGIKIYYKSPGIFTVTSFSTNTNLYRGNGVGKGKPAFSIICVLLKETYFFKGSS